MNARVCFVSAGPGSVDLITLRGVQRLAQAEVVLFDALTDPGLRAFAPQARWLDVGKRGFALAAKQAEINALLVHEAQHASALVVRLKGGDASVFGRLEEELIALAEAGIESEVVPGVTAALAAAAETQRPLTRRGSGRSVAVSTAVTQDRRLLGSRHAVDTEVFYMAGQQLPGLTERLLQAGWPPDTPTLAVSRAGCADALSSSHALQDLASAAALHHGRPTVITVGVGAQAVAKPAQDCATSKPHSRKTPAPT
ncbi:uroporphyrin-III C-methyltransferase [Inhella inkyongensis]|uniref:uroporphyrinogen-III C-methyltransferase n=1 Tax=Inhella inkyongensis TaxID=392593 RepID=A0A840S1B6_9BURK|nr:uroporphyrinogen-III C-methyltransferase [Inhella inkyongensis]MBB5203553.1 uroporphyrin-III C-methyltransferase [Inhella inkyongensis]